jgi:hypothetical protein
VPGTDSHDHERQRIIDEERARRNAQDARAAAADVRAGQDQTRQDAAAQQAQADQLAHRQIATAMYQPDGSYNYDAARAKAQEIGRPDLIEAVNQHQRENAPKPKPLMSVDPTHNLVDPNVPPGQPPRVVVPATPKPVAEPKPPEIGSFADYVTRGAAALGKPTNQLTPKDIEGFRKAYQQADDRPTVKIDTGAANNVRDAVAAMKDGSVPPQLPGRASKDYVAILAEAKRQGYDLAKAATDWNATQKHITTLNGAQQLRLNQAVNALPDMLDKVDALASQWKGGRFPILNKANLALAKGGAYGSDVASVANQLDAQIADVTADLGNVYMGGNSPTDHALGLAGKSLKGEWDEKVLHDMVKLAKTNVAIRQNSIKNTGVAGASADNPYAPPTPAAAAPAAPKIRARDPQGVLHEAPAGTPLPPGWTLVS